MEKQNQHLKRNEVDNYQDYLYNSNVRCPYCRGKIAKYTSVCPRCGVTKEQIYNASNVKAKQIKKQKTGEKIFMSRRRPNDVSFTTMTIALLGGMFGAHCFYVGRNLRGWIIATCTIIGILGVMIFPAGTEFRELFESKHLIGDTPMPFPTDIFFLIGMGIWLYDFVAVVFGLFKYPIRLGDNSRVKRK